jgi:hypothetical protein
MLRKTVITLAAMAALGVGSTAMAMHGGGGGGGGWGGGPGLGAAHPGGIGLTTMHGPMTTAPMMSGRVQGWGGHTAWGHDHDHFRGRFRNRNFFAFGFGGPYYDYAYGSCWSYVPTPRGWQYVYVCGNYPYGY